MQQRYIDIIYTNALCTIPILIYYCFCILQVRGFHLSSAQNAEARLKTFSIYRWNPDKPDQKPFSQEYKVDLNA